MEVLILAGGLGTRLRTVVQDVPKPMAPLNSFPFLHYIFKPLVAFKPSKIVLCVGYQHTYIQNYFKDNYLGLPIVYQIEEELLGTGGAIRAALHHIQGSEFLVLNGDSYFDCDFKALLDFHHQKQASVSFAAKLLVDFERYGTLFVDENSCIKAFQEKQYTSKGFINSGIYMMNRSYFEKHTPEGKFSLEQDFFEKQVQQHQFYAYLKDQEAYFIDIGIPEDYERAKTYFIP